MVTSSCTVTVSLSEWVWGGLSLSGARLERLRMMSLREGQLQVREGISLTVFAMFASLELRPP